MFGIDTRASERPIGVRKETLSEIVSIIVVLFGLLVFLSLVSESGTQNLIGRVGSGIYALLTFLVGKYVAHVFPLLILGAGFLVLRGNAPSQLPSRVAGLFFGIIALCAFAAMPYAEVDFRTQEGFRVGGAMGNFLMHRECIHLKGQFGAAGSYLFLTALLIIAAILVTDTHLRTILAFALRAIRASHPRHWFHRLAFWRLPVFESLLTSAAGRVQLEADNDGFDYDYEHPVRVEDRPRFTPAEESRVPTPHGTPAVRTAPPDNAVIDVLEQAVKATGRRNAQDGARRAAAPATDATLAAPQIDDLVDLAEVGTRQQEMELFKPYDLPTLSLLSPPARVESRITKEEMEEISVRLEHTLAEFGISAVVTQVTQGPTVTRFEIQPAAGVKVAKIVSLENDIAMRVEAESVRIIAPIPGKAAVGLEIPNRKPTPVMMREIIDTDQFLNHPSPLAFALGKTISGEPYICDLAKMPHLLIAGTTGSGKSVSLNAIICSILYRMPPDKVKFIMVDPKRVELNVYRDIPHLLAPVVCEPRKAAAALNWAIEQMEDRYKRLAALGVRNIDGYNAIVCSSEPHPKAIGRQLEYMPHIVIVIDELADLMIIARNEVEDSIIRLAQMSRAVGMHLIIATQRPSVNVITGIIKANFPSRIAFKVSSKVDSRTILDSNGAESLLSRGDMLFAPSGMPKPIRLQGCFLSDAEVERIADFVRGQQPVSYVKEDFGTRPADDAGALRMDGVDADDESVPMPGDDGADDFDYGHVQQRRDGGDGQSGRQAEDGEAIDEQLFAQAVKLILTHRKASVSMLQRKLKIGFARAGRVMDMVEEAGIVGPSLGSKVREIIVDPDEYLERMEEEEEAGF